MIHDGTLASLIRVSHVRYHSSHARVDPDVERPVLPADLISLQSETWAKGLLNEERARDFPNRALQILIVACLAGQRSDSRVDHFEHLPLVLVDEHGHAFDRPELAARRAAAIGAHRPDEVPAALRFGVEIAEDAAKTIDGLVIDDAPAFHGRLPVGGLLDQFLDPLALVRSEVRLCAFDLPPRRKFASGDVHDRFVGLRSLFDDCQRVTTERRSLFPGQHLGFRRFFQVDARIPAGIGELAGGLHDLEDGPVLRGGQRVERVRGGLRGRPTKCDEAQQRHEPHNFEWTTFHGDLRFWGRRTSVSGWEGGADYVPLSGR